MKYRFVIYGTKAVIKGAIALTNANILLCRFLAGKDINKELDGYMQSFDVSGVAALVSQEVSLVSDCKAEIIRMSTPEKKTEFICVETSFENAHLVWPSLVKIALQESLVALDVQLNKYVFEPLSLRFSWRDLSLRIQELNDLILHNTEAVWMLRRLYKQHFVRGSEAAYVLTLCKSREHNLRDRIKAFYDLLSCHLKPGEELICDDRRFVVAGEKYSISYTIEAYRKSPSLICYIDRGTVRVENLNRISCEQAFRWLRNNPGKKRWNYHRTIERLAFLEMARKYHNPADRFCASFNITKAQLRDFLDIDYSWYRYYGAQIMFHRVPLDQCWWQNEYDQEKISALKLDEEAASFILPFVKEQYAYFGDRYYMTDNHFPAQMLESIKDRLVEIRSILYSGENLDVLEPYLLHANFYAVDEKKEKYVYGSDKPDKLKELIGEYRLNIAHLYDVFIKWAEFQLEYSDDDDLYNIIGP